VTKKNEFGQTSASYFSLHKDEARKQRSINRHKKNENWNNKGTAGFWFSWLLWKKQSIKECCDCMKKN
jgi:hypothetical protein